MGFIIHDVTSTTGNVTKIVQCQPVACMWLGCVWQDRGYSLWTWVDQRKNHGSRKERYTGKVRLSRLSFLPCRTRPVDWLCSTLCIKCLMNFGTWHCTVHSRCFRDSAQSTWQMKWGFWRDFWIYSTPPALKVNFQKQISLLCKWPC